MDQLIAICGICRTQIPANDGVVSADLADLNGSNEDGFARWRVTHRGCHPNLDALTYGIELQQISTACQLLVWTAHMSEKTWLPKTDWMELVRTAGETGRLDTGLWLASHGVEQ
ncbi:hypothetical protein CDO52_12845 [Nocardiopsis gilva YIM 90087]|uniref:Uncharacterized protein n=1 Tax=Nocardiopsis gilva YIM 90087 TaxID=1235441 RepID=A0A223S5Y1_9ACTN|nr:hypothetical protein [Nocardiopsis gilva]ASU83557.1 hypothetical protein CDO52_12845 [Nocardiopsis gilva YIM 90087]